uniref:Ig-like domain-containing protein n=1 Tax=Hippocampus comes TaxID=109280 RepID=A0A3Q2XF89_HIPCM
IIHESTGAMMSNYTLTQWPAELGPLHQGDPVHLLCSVLFDQKNDTCAGRHSVHWLRVGSHSGLAHADGKTNEECDEMSPKRCIYKLFINVSESDGATYYCALQVCGNFMFANGTKLDLLGNSHKEILLFSSILAFSLLVVALLINIIMKNNIGNRRLAFPNPR